MTTNTQTVTHAPSDLYDRFITAVSNGRTADAEALALEIATTTAASPTDVLGKATALRMALGIVENDPSQPTTLRMVGSLLRDLLGGPAMHKLAEPDRRRTPRPDFIGSGFLDPALCMTILPASAGFPEFSIASIRPVAGDTTLQGLARAWRREMMRAKMLQVDADEDEQIDAITDARDARTALITEAMTMLRPESPRDVAALLDVALLIFDDEEGNLSGDVEARFRLLVAEAKASSYRIERESRHASV